jgi:hypothetical protein
LLQKIIGHVMSRSRSCSGKNNRLECKTNKSNSSSVRLIYTIYSTAGRGFLRSSLSGSYSAYRSAAANEMNSYSGIYTDLCAICKNKFKSFNSNHYTIDSSGLKKKVGPCCKRFLALS